MISYKYYRGGVQSLISTPFNLQLFANNKLISLDRTKDFLDGCKNIFFMQTDHLSNNEITSLVDGIMKPKPVDLSYYKSNIPNYEIITEIPQENLAYLNSGLIATNMIYMFSECNKLQSIPKLNIDTSQCVDMEYMFGNCKALTSLDLSNFNTSNVTDMEGMFGYCYALRSLDLSNWDTSNVTDMNGMFYYCRALTSLDLSNWDTSNVTNMSNMFYNCKALTSLDLSNFNTSKVTDMEGMFNACSSLTSLDLSNFNTSNVTDMEGMFGYCYALRSLDLSNWDTSNVTDMRYMFIYCQALEHIKGIIDMKSCTKYGSMFNQCPKLSGVKIKNPPQAYYDNKTQFESDIGLTSDKYEIVS